MTQLRLLAITMMMGCVLFGHQIGGPDARKVADDDAYMRAGREFEAAAATVPGDPPDEKKIVAAREHAHECAWQVTSLGTAEDTHHHTLYTADAIAHTQIKTSAGTML